MIEVCGLKGGVWFEGALPCGSGDEARDAVEGEAEDLLVRAGVGPLDADQGLQLGDAGSDLDETQAQGIELDGTPS